MNELNYTADRDEPSALLLTSESRRDIESRAADWKSQQRVLTDLLPVAGAAAHRSAWQASRSHRDLYSSYPASVGLGVVGNPTTARRARGQRLLKLALLQLEIRSITAHANTAKRTTKVQS